MNGSNGYQTYIKEAPTSRANDDITVTITLVPNTVTTSSSGSGSQNVKK